MAKNKEKKTKSKLRQKEARYGYLFILPWLIGFVALFLRPLLTSLKYAFSEVAFKPSGIQTVFNGIKNFKQPFEDSIWFMPNTFLPGITNFWYEAVLVCIFSLFVAIMLNQKFRGRTVARALFFLPVIIASGVVIQILQGNGMDTELETSNAFVFSSGGLEVLLNSVGLPASVTNLFTNISNRVFNVVWLSGIQIILYLSGLQSIPRSEYEAAEIEGATAWECFWKITWVRISPMTMVVVIYSIIDSLTNVSNPLIKWSYQQYTDAKYGISAAMSWLLCAIAFVVLIVVSVFMSRHIFYVNDEN